VDIDEVASPYLERAVVRRLSRRSDARGLLQLAMHVALLAATAVLVYLSRGHNYLAVALLLHGAVLSFLFCALHESVHGTAFASRWLNDGVAWVCGALLMLPPAYFRYFHFAHHRYTQDPVRDPELAVAPAASVGSWAWRVSGLPYWLDRLRCTLRHALTGRVTESFVPDGRRPLIVREARLLWATYFTVAAASICFASDAALVYWVLPALLGQPFLRLFLLAEHSGCPLTADMLANTRTTHTAVAVRLLTWRMSYHAEHHCFPSVPFHALRELNALIGARTRITAPGYLAVHRSLLRGYRTAARSTE
jgi:fatty acid desaturase